VTPLELTCKTCGAQIAHPPKNHWQRPVRVCCEASLAKLWIAEVSGEPVPRFEKVERVAPADGVVIEGDDL
jgi:hypothetical protein